MRDKLLHLLSDGYFISGERLAGHLRVSRTAVWKQIAALKNLGYDIESVKNKGYRLISRPDAPIAEEVTYELNTRVIGRELKYFNELPSTNLYAKQLVKSKVLEGTVVVAEVQTKGRGRKERTWFSPEGGLWFSVILFPNIPPQRGMILTMAASISIVQGIREVTGLNPAIKWPNDVLINGRKVCGVLTELDAEMDRINYSVVGIGVNVNNKLNAGLHGKATTLFKENGSRVSRVKLLRSILKNFDENYSKLMDDNYDFIRKSWISFSNIIDRKIRVGDGHISMEGVVTGVDEDGSLILKTEMGIQRVLSGNVEYL